MDLSDKKNNNIIKRIKEKLELLKHYSEYEERLSLEIKSNSEYITWLEHFTEQVPMFGEYYVSNLKYKELLDTDKINMKNIRILFNIVNKYANKNYIYPKYHDNSEYYLIEYNNIIYEIGLSSKLNGYTYYCRRVSNVDVADEVMNYNDIMEDKVRKRTNIINIKLTSLDNILDIYSESVPVEALEKQVYDSIENIKTKKKVR